MKKKYILFLSVVLLLVGLSAAADHISRFSVRLVGSREVPPVDTDADGRFTARANLDDDKIDFRLRVDDMENVTMAHLHCASPGENGPIVVTLFGMVHGGFDVDGELADYTITEDNIEPTAAACSPPISDFDDLADAMRTGMIYVKVHTMEHPGGEIRAQVGTFVASVAPTPTPTITVLPEITPTPTPTPTPEVTPTPTPTP